MPTEKKHGEQRGGELKADEQTFDIRITGGSPTAQEVAAVTAVISAALEELADDHGRRLRLTPTAWERSQRSVRTPLTPGSWTDFPH